jgi:hypothetical protein
MVTNVENHSLHKNLMLKTLNNLKKTFSYFSVAKKTQLQQQ